MAVIGGGNSGVEAAIDLAGIVGHVTLIEFMDEMRADAVLQKKLKSLLKTKSMMLWLRKSLRRNRKKLRQNMSMRRFLKMKLLKNYLRKRLMKSLACGADLLAG